MSRWITALVIAGLFWLILLYGRSRARSSATRGSFRRSVGGRPDEWPDPGQGDGQPGPDADHAGGHHGGSHHGGLGGGYEGGHHGGFGGGHDHGGGSVGGGGGGDAGGGHHHGG